MISPWATLLLASVFCGQPFMQPHQQDGGKEPLEQTSKSASSDVNSASATDTDYRLIEIVALDLLRNKKVVRNFGTVPKGQKIPRRMWINPTTLPFEKFVLEGTNADFTYSRDQRGPQDAYDIPDAIQHCLIRRNKTPVTLADFKPQNPSVMLDPSAKEGVVITNLTFKYAHGNTGWLKVWLPGFSQDSKQAVLRFFTGPAAHGMEGAYMLTKQGTNWKIKWRYLTSAR